MPIDTLSVSPPAYDFLFYGGYLYTSNREAIGIYDTLSDVPILKSTLAMPNPTTLIPRLYRWKNQLIVPYYTDWNNNGVYFFDLTNPIQPTLIYHFNHEIIYEETQIRGFAVSGFPSNYSMGRCDVGKDYIVCPWDLLDDNPLSTNYYYVTPLAFHFPDYKTTVIRVSLPDVECGDDSPLSQLNLIFLQDRFLWAWGSAYCDVQYATIDEAYQNQEEYAFSCRFCDYIYYDYQYVSNTSQNYKQWLITQYYNELIQTDTEDYIWPVGKPIEFPPGMCQRIDIQELYGHENWIYGTEYGCGNHLLNFDPTIPWDVVPIVGLNDLATTPYALKVINNILYVAGETSIYRFEPVGKDISKPKSTIHVSYENDIVHFWGSASDDDGVKGVYIRIGDTMMIAEEFAEDDNVFDSSRHHTRPFEGPSSWKIDLDTSTLEPGVYNVKTIAVDWEGSFSVIDEREIEIGTGLFGSNHAPVKLEKRIAD
ncbi:MAG TPA: hypothetical protein PK014_12870 [Thermoanaerobaculia bacterium]|nr:hypothetical protein [Thermoanaerobaculia bacterium]HUM30976.1 hypothetical protein [Thermoanaerobaculia bacterium]HXK69291.1 hypothetical protein [Thermoanaerobaculia bacterium]